MFLKSRHIYSLLILLTSVWVSVSCDNIESGMTLFPDEGRIENTPSRMPNNEYRNVFIVYSMGFNNLTRYLSEDVEDLIANTMISNPRDVLLIFSHKANWYTGERYPRYSEPTAPTLTRVVWNTEGVAIRDTLMVMPDTASSADAGTLNTVLSYIHENFKADRYGMLMSSHGTGWVPEDYCNHPERYDESSSDIWRLPAASHVSPKPFDIIQPDGTFPAVKSIGVQNISNSELTEMDITEVADAIPMKLDFIIFDACFMGGIETAYQLRNVCGKVVFSQTEILADGMDYQTMSSYIFNGKDADLEGFCRNYHNFYDQKNGDYRSATISLIDCTGLDALAEACRNIFETYRTGIKALEGTRSVQRYFRSQYADYHQWFYDLRSIAEACGTSELQMRSLDDALGKCVIYKAATPSVLGIPIKSHCGLSMYLPFENRTYLNNFYKTLDWNKDTNLVQ